MTEVPQGVRDRIKAAAIAEAEEIASEGKNYDRFLHRWYTVAEMTRNIQRNREGEWLRGVNLMTLVPL